MTEDQVGKGPPVDRPTAAAREAALREILSVISRSRDDAAPVFETLRESVQRLFGASNCAIVLGEEGGGPQVLATQIGASETTIQRYREGFFRMDPEVSIAARAIIAGETLYYPDVAKGAPYLEGMEAARMHVEVEGIRTSIYAPLLLNGRGIGCINLLHDKPRAYSPDDIALLETFAAQAVIAIENVRQFRELQNRLEREQATREVLSVISRSRDDDAPVFDVILGKAAAICAADQATLQLVSDDRSIFRLAAGWGLAETAFPIGAEWPLKGSQPVPQAILSGRSVNVADFVDTERYRAGEPTVTRIVDAEGVRSRVAVPLLRDGVAVGAISLSRREVRPFDDADIQVVETFAAQAVIAIENVRQFREVQTRLERERATREILGVISRSRDDATPVFEIILETAKRLCRASNGAIVLGRKGGGPQVLATQTGASELTLKRYRDGVYTMDPDASIAARAIVLGETLYYPKVAEGAPYREGMEAARMLVEVEGIKTSLYVPLMLEGQAIGCLNLHHLEQRTYTDDEIALVEGFAAQAVIAIENVRQFREVQERLEREQASRDVLDVISTSRDDDIPVFETILQNASRICNAPIAFLSLASEDRTEVRIPAHLGTRSEFGDILEGFVEPITRTELVAVRPVASGQTVLEDDIKDDEAYRNGDPRRLQMVDVEGARSVLAVPLMRGETPIGAIVLYRREVAPFSEDDLTLVRNFAAQAVIAIENVRQFNALETLNAELGDRVEEQVGEIERMGRLKRFLPAQVADAVVTKGDDILSSHRALIATLFCDMRGFTAFCERAEPEETIEVLQTYHEEMGRLLSEYGAGVEHRLGDGIMAIFNDPLPCDDPAGDAVRLALAMRARMEELCKGWRRLGHRLGFGVGVSLGYATVGMVGSEGRYEYTASGTAVNLASRLCDRAEDGEILISARAFAAVEGDFEIEPHGEVTLKGIQDPAPVFRVA